MGRADDMSYIGEYLQITISGNIAGWDIYPASHIIGATLSIGTGLAPHLVSFLIPFIFSFLFVMGLFLFSRIFLKDTALINIAIPSSFILYIGPYNFLNVPHALFFAIMPLFLFLLCRFIKDPDSLNVILISPFIFLVPFMHPFIVLFVVSTFCILIIFNRILQKLINVNYWRITSLIMIVFAGFFAWFIYGTTLLDSFKKYFLAYIERTTEPVFFETTEKLARITIDSFKIFKLFTLYYGRYIIPLIIIAVAIIIIYYRRDRISQVLKNYMVFGVFFYFVFFCLELILFFNPIISHQPDRLTNLNFIVFAQVPLFVLSLYVIFMKPEPSNRKIVILLFLLSVLWGLSLFGTFNSPNIFKINDALTYNEVQGMQWFYESRTTDKIITPLSQIGRFHHLLADEPISPSLALGTDYNIYVPDHFGYMNNDRSFSEINLYPGEESYIILLTIDELLYQKVPGYIEVGRYTADDFSRFRNDNSINKIFDDMNIDIYYGNRF
jgi:hypothetical protein